MRLYSYSIINSGEKLPNSINGIEGAYVYNLPYRDIGIVVSEFNEHGVKELKDVLDHEKVVENLMKKFTVLPFKFFTVLKNTEAVFSMMDKYYDDFIKNLDRLHNKVEFGLKVVWDGDIIRDHIINSYEENNSLLFTANNSPVTDFINEKFKNYKINNDFTTKAHECVEFVNKFFNKFAIEKKLDILKTNNLILNAFYLVEQKKQNDFKKAYKALMNNTNNLKYLFSGPWPPYNFISLNKHTPISPFDIPLSVSPLIKGRLEENFKEKNIIYQ